MSNTVEQTFALPTGFEGLAKFRAWGLPTEGERIARRLETPMPEVQEYYDGMMAELPKIMAYLLERPATNTTPEDENLLFLMFSLHEIAQAVEIYGCGEVVDGADVRLFTSVLDRPGGEVA
jgi:hypothetical protein